MASESKFLSEDEKAEWEAFLLKRTEAQSVLCSVNEGLHQLAAKAFIRSMEGSHWVWKDEYLIPADQSTRDELRGYFSWAMSLGYHDTFVVQTEKMDLYCDIDDNDMCISAYVQDTQTEDATLDVCGMSIDLSEMFFIRTKELYQKLMREREKMTRKLKKLRKLVAVQNNE